MGTVYQVQEDGTKARNRDDIIADMIYLREISMGSPSPLARLTQRVWSLRCGRQASDQHSPWQVIASSRRQDGSYRKPVRVREGDAIIRSWSMVCRSSILVFLSWP